MLAINGRETQNLTEAFSAMADSRAEGFNARELCDEVQNRQKDDTSTLAHVYGPAGSAPSSSKNYVLFPLRRPKLQLYEHVVWDDPHRTYLDGCNTTEIHRDGTSEVLKVDMGPDTQEFSAALGFGPSVS